MHILIVILMTFSVASKKNNIYFFFIPLMFFFRFRCFIFYIICLRKVLSLVWYLDSFGSFWSFTPSCPTLSSSTSSSPSIKACLPLGKSFLVSSFLQRSFISSSQCHRPSSTPTTCLPSSLSDPFVRQNNEILSHLAHKGHPCPFVGQTKSNSIHLKHS